MNKVTLTVELTIICTASDNALRVFYKQDAKGYIQSALEWGGLKGILDDEYLIVSEKVIKTEVS